MQDKQNLTKAHPHGNNSEMQIELFPHSADKLWKVQQHSWSKWSTESKALCPKGDIQIEGNTSATMETHNRRSTDSWT
jgi:hypothetical protein